MSDDRLQLLRRTWEQEGTTGALSAYLRECARAGALAPSLLELAAYCGHEAARDALGVDAPGELEPWARGLARWGPGVQLRALVEAVTLTQPVFESARRREGVFERTLEGCRRALAEVPPPPRELDEAVRQTWNLFVPTMAGVRFAEELDDPRRLTPETLAALPERARRANDALGALYEVVHLHQGQATLDLEREVYAQASAATSPAAVCGWTRRALARWALAEVLDDER